MQGIIMKMNIDQPADKRTETSNDMKDEAQEPELNANMIELPAYPTYY